MVIFACVIPDPYSSVAPGKWRGVLKLEGSKDRPLNKKGKPLTNNLKMEEVMEGELPFNFEVHYETPEQPYLVVLNGKERIEVRDVKTQRSTKTGEDTIWIRFPHYDSHIKALYEEDVIQGYWIVENRENYQIPFVARQGRGHRFTTLKKTPKADLTGKWEVMFGTETDDPYPAVGEFVQKGNHLTGTFMTETGDFRYLEGTVQDNKMYLSTFDGSHAFLFEAKIMEDGTLLGAFLSGNHYKTIWEARRNENYQLTPADSLTFLKPEYGGFDFSFPDANGTTVSLQDERFKNKIKIVQIMGTWCPNCADETVFLTDYLKKNGKGDLEIISLAYEKHKEKAKALNAIGNFKKRFGVPYDVLWAGSSSKKEAAKTLPMLNHVLSYPTMIFLDRKNNVRKIHTGFSGPATSQYDDFVKDFDVFVKKLLEE